MNDYNNLYVIDGSLRALCERNSWRHLWRFRIIVGDCERHPEHYGVARERCEHQMERNHWIVDDVIVGGTIRRWLEASGRHT